MQTLFRWKEYDHLEKYTHNAAGGRIVGGFDSRGYIPCDKVTWVTTSDVHGTGSAGVLLSSSYSIVFQSSPAWTSGSTQVGWTLAPIGESVYAGDHVLTATWKVESL